MLLNDIIFWHFIESFVRMYIVLMFLVFDAVSQHVKTEIQISISSKGLHFIQFIFY